MRRHLQPGHRQLPRRRGAALNSAIFEAVLAEIAESGYSALTMDRAAERAHASKASLYRLDTLTVMRQAARQLEGRAGQAIRAVLGEALRNPGVAAEVHEFARGNAATMMREIVARAVSRGECDPALVTENRIEAGPALLRQ